MSTSRKGENLEFLDSDYVQTPEWCARDMIRLGRQQNAQDGTVRLCGDAGEDER